MFDSVLKTLLSADWLKYFLWLNYFPGACTTQKMNQWKGTAGSQLVDTNCRCNWSLFCFRPSQIVLSYTGNKLNFFSLNLLGCDIVAIYETMDEGWVLDNIQFLLEILCHLPYKGSTYDSGTTTQLLSKYINETKMAFRSWR